jgi:hypothetical protein
MLGEFFPGSKSRAWRGLGEDYRCMQPFGGGSPPEPNRRPAGRYLLN